MRTEAGHTLVELVAAIAVLSILAAGSTGILSMALRTQAYADRQCQASLRGALAMRRLTQSVRTSTYVLAPNAYRPNGSVLIVSGRHNEDGDYHFGDPLFPRVDEDTGREMVSDGKSGIKGFDDDGDGSVDDGPTNDDDEDGWILLILSGGIDEDRLDGVDNDGDGNIDEDPGDDMGGDGEPGIDGMDDDGDGAVDEGDIQDDDEDGLRNEDPLNPLRYVFRAAEHRLVEVDDGAGREVTVCEQVQGFTATYQAASETRDPRLVLRLTLSDGAGGTVVCQETVFPRNIVQNPGKRVR